MSVLHLETGRRLYGGALQVLYLARGLQERGVESVVVVPRGSEVASEARRRRLRVEEFPYRGEADLLALPRLAWRFSRRDVQLVHLHSRRGADTLGVAAARLARAPVVLTRRVDTPEPAWLAGTKYRLCRRVVAISEAVSEVLGEQGVPTDKISLVRSAVDPSDWQEPLSRAERDREFDLPSGVPAGAMVAQFIPRKGHCVLVDALATLRGRGVAPPAMVLFGRGPLEGNARSLAEAAGVADLIRFAGYRSDLHRWLGSFDLCVHPALSEGLGVAALQAGAAGVPLVASWSGGLPEVVGPEGADALCPPGDAGALATAIQGVLSDPERAKARAQRARRRVERHFSVGEMVERNLDVYREVVASKRCPAGLRTRACAGEEPGPSSPWTNLPRHSSGAASPLDRFAPRCSSDQ
ncbi:MAG: glycosyltransferase family 4 protein [Gemmatimonadetes bacterium]|nr:glycosyltransferase family 4 protein [Gemmatimonadota bacterium]